MDEMLVEILPRGNNGHFLLAYPFEGRLAHTTLCMLLTKRLERAGRRADRPSWRPTYALAVGGAADGRP